MFLFRMASIKVVISPARNRLCSQPVSPRVLAVKMAMLQLAKVGYQELSGFFVLSVAGIPQAIPWRPPYETPAGSTCCHSSGGGGHSQE